MSLKRVGSKEVARGPLARLFRAALHVVAILFVGVVFLVMVQGPPLQYLLGNHDRQAFYIAFQYCQEMTIATKRFTVEGDPIYSYGEIFRQDERGCGMRIKVDYSADRFGDPRRRYFNTYCYSLKIESNSDSIYPEILIATNCTSRGEVRL